MADGRQTRLAELLETRRINQVDLAREVGADSTHFSRWVRGVHKPNRFYRREIVKALKKVDVQTTAEELWPRG
jgi:hypothetical protein